MTLAIGHAWADTAPAATPQASATAPGTALRSTEWRVECGNSGKALDCQIINRILQPNGDTLASIAIHPIAAGKVAGLVQLPLGLALGAPVQLNVDKAAVLNLSLDTCLMQGCIASAILPPAFISAAENGSKLTLTFTMANDKSLSMAVPLDGFSLAFHFVTRK